ncbi:V-type_proton ATPase subunit a [Hexamita inflata]|uniref:V-type proton ATPase subunit a n=1 Tax=Hexamita inflata TaxID=28002 RepID=A0AA86PD56_9EUKA|nr:V-type proton ATPase subunit a [Hexamita inflata]
MSASELWRSKTMKHCNLIMKRDASAPILQGLMHLNTVQFIDMNENVPAFSRTFSKDIAKIYDVEQKLNFMRTAIEHSTVRIPDQLKNIETNSIVSLEQELDKVIGEYKSLAADYISNRQRNDEIYEQLLVYKNLSKVDIKDQAERDNEEVKLQAQITGALVSDENADDSLNSVVFTIQRKLTYMVIKTLYRVTYGNIYYETFQFEERLGNDDESGDKDLVSLFVPGQESLARCQKVLNSFGAHMYEVPDNVETAKKNAVEALDAFNMTLLLSKQRQDNILAQTAKYIDFWTEMVHEQRQITHTMNMFNTHEDMVSCRCWIPEDNMERVRAEIEAIDFREHVTAKTMLVEEEVPKGVSPPTHFPTNKYTAVFQAIVSSYGTPTYKEINPAYFYLYQFPFTYSMMFGDMCHGFINAFVAFLLIFNEKKLEKIHNDMFELIFFGRYIIFIMSCYSMITGLIYNDFYALGFNVFGTTYKWALDTSGTKFVAENTKVYPFGIDATWHWADNSMIFLNSYKMKLSVVIGIMQMLFGLIVKLINLINQKKTAQIICVWIPEFGFMFAFFGYMVFCIIYKWLVHWPEDSNPPALINMLIQIFLSPGTIDPTNQLFNSNKVQSGVQTAVFLFAVIFALWLMLAEPIHEVIHMKKHPNPETDRALSDIIVQQVIHTIEYVLGCISHTASYLRLWALSLAHSQLAEVFFDQLLGISIKMTGVAGGALSLLITYGAFFGATIGVLCMMEALSAYLHCLRLAWIEFNSKFFTAEGYTFEPLNGECGYGLAITSDMVRSE